MKSTKDLTLEVIRAKYYINNDRSRFWGLLVTFFVWALLGITSVRNIHKIIDLALAKKLSECLRKVGIKKECNINFEDMVRAGCPPLKIIATNTATESFELFCAERRPDVAVAVAVAASICLPITFKPKRPKFTRKTPFNDLAMTGIFLEGELVSNLPAWALDEERLLYPGVPKDYLKLVTTVAGKQQILVRSPYWYGGQWFK
ncbi:hypothetical protein AEQ67_18155 [Pseudomonas sp. RIT-PI-q]|uniref:hypothetical protein n=1 Tax=Pseudomonas sp. RIT-PI-q TaxID=1690247 RepID=UPI0006CD8A3E|nr:hypothetical protein [Pseudomonas sp. RIT-PI-q]KPG95881.1 hypothetical protein AEQ67_18155 [Pseudomonas sp. RIT-PI-q]